MDPRSLDEAVRMIAALNEEMVKLQEHCHKLHDDNVRLEGILAELQAKVKYTLPNLVELPVGNTTITRS